MLDPPNERASVDKMETGTTHKEHQARDGLLNSDDMWFLEHFTEDEKKRVIRKVDVRVLYISLA